MENDWDSVAPPEPLKPWRQYLEDVDKMAEEKLRSELNTIEQEVGVLKLKQRTDISWGVRSERVGPVVPAKDYDMAVEVYESYLEWPDVYGKVELVFIPDDPWTVVKSNG